MKTLKRVLNNGVFSRTLTGAVLILFLGGGLALSGCTTAGNSKQSNWQEDGMIVLARPAPPVNTESAYSSEHSKGTVFGFLPSLEAGSKPWLLLSTAENKLKLMQGKELKLAVNLDAQAISASQLEGGVYEIIHKQRHPVWHATEEYFAARHIDAPAEGDAERFLKGALGDFALFTDKEMPIHSGPIELPELGGLRLKEDDIARIYYHLEVGSQFIVE